MPPAPDAATIHALALIRMLGLSAAIRPGRPIAVSGAEAGGLAALADAYVRFREQSERGSDAMGWRFVRQPDGMLARFSEVVD